MNLDKKKKKNKPVKNYFFFPVFLAPDHLTPAKNASAKYIGKFICVQQSASCVKVIFLPIVQITFNNHADKRIRLIKGILSIKGFGSLDDARAFND